MPRRRGARPVERHAAPVPRAQGDPRDRRLRPRVLLLHLRAHVHRRRRRHGAARRTAAAGHGIRAVPPDRHLRCGLPDHRGLAGRGRLPDEFRRRALHGALRAEREGPCVARRREPLDDDRDPRGPWRRRAQGPHPPAPRASRRGSHPRAPAGHCRDGAHLRRRRCHEGADPGAAHGALQHGRHPVQRARRGRGAARRQSRCGRARPDGHRRGGVRLGARRESPRVELAARSRGLRPRRRASLRQHREARHVAQAAAEGRGRPGGELASTGSATPTASVARRRSGSTCSA